MSDENYLNLRKTILEKIKNNNITIKMNTVAKAEIISEYDIKKSGYEKALISKNLNYLTKEKLQLEYTFAREQHFYKKMKIEHNINNLLLYNSRLEAILTYVNAKKNKTYEEAHNKLYGINSAVIKESLAYYEDLIEYNKQERILNGKFKCYMDFLKENKDSDHAKYVKFLPSNEEIIDLDDKIDGLVYKKNILRATFIEEKFTIDDKDINSPRTCDSDIISLVMKMYPNFKDKLLECQEKQKQVA